MLGIGGFVNVNIPTYSSFSGNFHTLKCAADPAFKFGQVWETIRKDWVWESGAYYSGTNGIISPISISGVYVNNNFILPSHPTSGFYLDYRNGRAVFNNPIPSNSFVAMNYSYRWVQVYVADNAPWFFEGQYVSFRPGDQQWNINFPYSGDFSASPNMRYQFPVCIIEAVPKRTHEPYEMGNSASWIQQDVIFNIVGENKWSRDKLMDILDLEYNHILQLYDTDKVIASGLSPLDYRGNVANSTGTYPYLIGACPFAKMYIKDVQMAEVETLNPRLYEGKIRWVCEVILAKI